MRKFVLLRGYVEPELAIVRAMWEPIDMVETSHPVNVDIVEELSRMLSEEIDREIINNVIRRINGIQRL